MLIITILYLVFASSFVLSEKEEYVICKSSVKHEIEVIDSEDVPGRITVTWCPKDNRIRAYHSKEWFLDLYVDIFASSPDDCSNSTSSKGFREHSNFMEILKIHEDDYSCANICVTKTLDLIYTGCYKIMNFLDRFVQNEKIMYIDHENITKDYFEENINYQDPNVYYSTKSLKFKVYTTAIPMVDFTICVENVNRTDNMEYIKYCHRTDKPIVNPAFNCSVIRWNVVQCVIRDAMNQSWKANLIHEGPWTASHEDVLNDRLKGRINSRFRYEDDTPAKYVPPRSGEWWRWLVVSVLTTLTVFAAAVLYRYLVRQRIRSRKSAVCVPCPAPISPSLSPLRYVVLYERDHTHFLDAVDAFIALLREQLPKHITVVDIHATDTVAEIVEAGDIPSWVTSRINDDRVTFLLIESAAIFETLPLNIKQGRIPRRSSPGCRVLQEAVLHLRNIRTFPAHRRLTIITTAPSGKSVVGFPGQPRYRLPVDLPHLLCPLPQCPSLDPTSPRLHDIHRHVNLYLHYIEEHPHYLHTDKYFMD